MKLGILQFELLIHDASSLKDKRRVVKSFKDRIHRAHLVSVAEVGDHSLWNRATIGVAAVSSDGQHLHQVLDRILQKARTLGDAELGDVLLRDVMDASAHPLLHNGDPLWTPQERRSCDGAES